jgi:hypothetical protein
MPDFYYRANGDGTTDSICTKCFQTVVTARALEQIRHSEEVHQCLAKVPVPVSVMKNGRLLWEYR